MNSKQYRPDVDGLRAVAVIGVVTFHAFPIWVPGGFVGVDIFFVISGFLITSIITKEMEDKTFSFPTFYARRARRIFPALVVVLATLLGVGWFLLLADEYAAVGKHTAAGAGFIANIAFFQEAGYFDASAKFKPLLHLWSLGIEEQFYLVWPALLFFRRPVSRMEMDRRRLGRSISCLLLLVDTPKRLRSVLSPSGPLLGTDGWRASRLFSFRSARRPSSKNGRFA